MIMMTLTHQTLKYLSLHQTPMYQTDAYLSYTPCSYLLNNCKAEERVYDTCKTFKYHLHQKYRLKERDLTDLLPKLDSWYLGAYSLSN